VVEGSVCGISSGAQFRAGSDDALQTRKTLRHGALGPPLQTTHETSHRAPAVQPLPVSWAGRLSPPHRSHCRERNRRRTPARRQCPCHPCRRPITAAHGSATRHDFDYGE